MRVVNLELDEDFLQRFFDLTGDKVPETITLISLKKQVLSIKERIRQTLAQNDGSTAETKNKKSNNDDTTDEDKLISNDTRSMLLVDNLGVITYQIQMIMSKLGFKVTVSKEVYNTISMFEENNYDLILIDLLIPTEREGLILLNQLKKIAKNKNTNTIIGTMSVAGKKELKNITVEQGADFYIEKSMNWQEKLKETIESYIEG